MDHDHGGFYGRIDGHDQLHTDAQKGIILNARILWSFSAVYQSFPAPELLELANRADQYLQDHFIDREFNGVIWMVDHKGHPLQTRKQVYAQAFAIYAWSEHFKTTGNATSLNIARSLFKVLEEKAFDPIYGGYFEAFNQDWSVTDDLRLSDKDQNDQKSMNTMLHVLEAYTNLYQVWPDPRLMHPLRKIVIAFLHYILNRDAGSFHLFFAEDWSVRSDKKSYGHDIEAVWLLHDAVKVLDDQELIQQVQKLAVKVAEQVIKEGIDEDGGLINEAFADGSKDTNRHWWPQAELMVGMLDLWQITKEESYLEVALKNWNFTKRYLIDADREWFFKVDAQGIPDRAEDKAGFWKCPYHNSRFCLEVSNRLDDIE